MHMRDRQTQRETGRDRVKDRWRGRKKETKRETHTETEIQRQGGEEVEEAGRGKKREGEKCYRLPVLTLLFLPAAPPYSQIPIL